MKTTHVTIQWPRGLHMRAAAGLVRLARRFRSRIQLRLGTGMADARSILSVLMLSASLGAVVDIEAAGNDEHEAVQAVEEFFASPSAGDDFSSEEYPGN